MNNYSQFMSTPEMQVALRNSSVSADDARLRGIEYAKMFSRNEDMFGVNMNNANLLQKTFSGYSETPLLSTQYFNASVASYVSSFAGYMSIERDFDQPNGLFYWFDVLGVSDLRPVIPNLGADNYQDVQTMGHFESDLTVDGTTTDYDYIVGRKLIPGTIRVKIQDKDNKKYELVDDGQGHFMAVAGVISSGTLNYLNGKVSFSMINAVDATAVQKFSIDLSTGVESFNEAVADVNADGRVSILDATCIQKYAVKFKNGTGRTGQPYVAE